MGYMVDEENDIPEDTDESGNLITAEDDNDPHADMLPPPSLNPFKNSFLPFLVLNKNLKIVYANEACEAMFSGLTILGGKHFFDLFGKAFNAEDEKKIREMILSERKGLTWKGFARLKTRGMAETHIRAYIYPLEMDLNVSGDFAVMFDDFSECDKKLFNSVFLSLLEASKLNDNDAGNHTIRVNEYSKRFAEELFNKHADKYDCIDKDFIDNIGFLAAMHDIGKIGTPDYILNKKGPLLDREIEVMREHTKNGALMLSTYPNPMAKEIALFHHEKWDGTGYPFRLEGEIIPLSARIVSIAEVYDALRMERCYKPAFKHEMAKQKITEQKGAHFDPALIEIFDEISDGFEEIYSSYAG